ncbi:MAG: M24 family metallopeptidase [Spirochaetota bacterium]
MQTVEKKSLDRRLSNFRNKMSKKGVDCSIVWDPDNEFYLSGFRAISYSRPIVLLIFSDKVQYIIPALEEDHAKLNANADEFFVYHEKIQQSHLDTSYDQILKRILEHMPKKQVIGVEMGIMPASVHTFIKELGFRAADIGEDLIQLRSIKDEEEVYWLDQAGRLSDIAIKASIEQLRPGISELEFDSYGDRALLETASKEFPHNIVGYENWTCSGIERSSMPHLYSSTRKFTTDDVIVHSRQVWINGYRAENERTLLLGTPTKEQRKCMETAIEAQNVGFEVVKPGVKAKEVDIASFEVFEKAGYGDYVQHRIGHGLGLSEHEEPYLRFDNELILEEGMVYTIEPGIYIPGVGGFRHSDTIIVTKNGCRSITTFPRSLQDISR